MLTWWTTGAGGLDDDEGLVVVELDVVEDVVDEGVNGAVEPPPLGGVEWDDTGPVPPQPASRRATTAKAATSFTPDEASLR